MRVVVATREKKYPRREEAHPFKKERQKRRGRGGKRRLKRKDWSVDRGGVGHEIARELRACPSCVGARDRDAHMDVVKRDVLPHELVFVGVVKPSPTVDAMH